MTKESKLAIALESRCRQNMTDTLAQLELLAISKEWKVLTIHNLQASLAKNGQEVLPIQILEMCNPSISGKMLDNDEERLISVFMPCRISVYEKKDGFTYLSRMNAPQMAAMLTPHMAEVMAEAFKQMEEIVHQVIQS